MISSLRGHVSTHDVGWDVDPELLLQVVIEEITIEVTRLLLVPSKEIELFLKVDSLGTRSGHWKLSDSRQEAPLAGEDIVAVEVVLAIVVVSATEQVDAVFHQDAIVARTRSKATGASRLNLHPLADGHIHEVFGRELMLRLLGHSYRWHRVLHHITANHVLAEIVLSRVQVTFKGRRQFHCVVHRQVHKAAATGKLFQLVVSQVTAFLLLVKENAVDVVPLLAVETSEDVHDPLEHEGLVESTCRR